MTSSELVAKYFQFFEERGHKALPAVPLVPENDSSTLFIVAGMQPIVPYFAGLPHPLGQRLVSNQRVIRTVDIDEIGDAAHLTVFEMLGNWSLGDYFKKEAIAWSFEFLTDQKWLGLGPERLYVSVFEGDQDASQDDESIGIWKDTFKGADITAELAHPNEGIGESRRIFTYGKADNWWGPPGETGPCGPDTEMFYDTLDEPGSAEHHPSVILNSIQDPSESQRGRRDPGVKPQDDRGELRGDFSGPCHPACQCGRFIEVWNDVFIEYNKLADGTFETLSQQNVDTGLGLERMALFMQGVETVYETDLFAPIMDRIRSLIPNSTFQIPHSERVVADHLRSATFLIMDGLIPSNVDQGYVLRRLIRRAIRHGRQLGITEDFTTKVAEAVIENFGARYPEMIERRQEIHDVLAAEEAKFRRTLDRGLREFEKFTGPPSVGKGSSRIRKQMTGKDLFRLYETYGFPIELSAEVAEDRQVELSPKHLEEFSVAEEEHQALSRKGSEQKFAGGLADHSVGTTRLHTATHLLLEALRRVLGDHVQQKGSNITGERLRFDFNHPESLTPEQLKEVEGIVNEQIQKNWNVHFEEMPLVEATAQGVTGVFGEKYGERVKVYFIGDPEAGEWYSREICGGPHVTHTGELGTFRIVKEESSGAGVRRIRAVLE